MIGACWHFRRARTRACRGSRCATRASRRRGSDESRPAGRGECDAGWSIAVASRSARRCVARSEDHQGLAFRLRVAAFVPNGARGGDVRAGPARAAARAGMSCFALAAIFFRVGATGQTGTWRVRCVGGHPAMAAAAQALDGSCRAAYDRVLGAASSCSWRPWYTGAPATLPRIACRARSAYDGVTRRVVVAGRRYRRADRGARGGWVRRRSARTRSIPNGLVARARGHGSGRSRGSRRRRARSTRVGRSASYPGLV